MSGPAPTSPSLIDLADRVSKAADKDSSASPEKERYASASSSNHSTGSSRGRVAPSLDDAQVPSGSAISAATPASGGIAKANSSKISNIVPTKRSAPDTQASPELTAKEAQRQRQAKKRADDREALVASRMKAIVSSSQIGTSKSISDLFLPDRPTRRASRSPSWRRRTGSAS